MKKFLVSDVPFVVCNTRLTRGNSLAVITVWSVLPPSTTITSTFFDPSKAATVYSSQLSSKKKSISQILENKF